MTSGKIVVMKIMRHCSDLRVSKILLVTKRFRVMRGVRQSEKGTYFWYVTDERWSNNNAVHEISELAESGGYSEKVTPVPIPNTEVKLFRADDTWWATAWKSRSLPVLQKSRLRKQAAFLVQNGTP